MLCFDQPGLRPFLVGLTVLSLLGCSAPAADPGQPIKVDTEQPTTVGNGPEIVQRDDWSSEFEAIGSNGTFVLHKIGSGQIEVYEESRARKPMPPASTFKILNSMIILETGVLPDVDTVVPWDGVDRELSSWNQDHSLRSGIEVSAVWMYQDLAPKVGESQMEQWVTEANYGNENIGGSIDSFWLDGDLRISALEQVDFLTRLVQGELPFRPETVDATRQILVRESGPGWSWSHKTGLSLTADPDLGWIVGTTEFDGSTWVFALNVDLESNAGQIDPEVRQMIARRILEGEGALPTP